MNELKLIILNKSLLPLLQEYNILSEKHLAKLSTEMIKGILFEYYSLINNKVAYNNINARSLQYKDRINDSVLKEGYIIYERLIELQDKYLYRKKESNTDEEEFNL